MTLLVAPPAWANCSHNIGNPNNLTYGTGITAGANNADGSAASILSALTHDVEYLVLGFTGFSSSSGAINPSCLLDILIDPAGGTSWASLIDDLLVGGTYPINLISATVGVGTPLWYYFPLWIPSGASLGAQARTAHTSTFTGRVMVFAYGANRNPGSWWAGRKVTSFGINAASSRGTDHTPGTSSSYSSWASLGSTLSIPASAYQWAVQGENDTDWSNTGPPYHFQFGISSTQIGPIMIKGISAGEVGCLLPPPGPQYYPFPAGAQLQVRAAAQGASAQTLDVAAYLVS